MTKAEIISRISEQTGIDKQTALAVVESFMTEVKKSLSDNEPVFFVGSAASFSSTVQIKPQEIFQPTQRWLCLPMTSRPSNRPRNLFRLSASWNNVFSLLPHLQYLILSFPQGEIPFFFPCCRTVIWHTPFITRPLPLIRTSIFHFQSILSPTRVIIYPLQIFNVQHPGQVPPCYFDCISHHVPICENGCWKYSENSLPLFLMHIVLFARQNWHPHRRQKASDIREVKMSVKRKQDNLWTHMFSDYQE